MIRSFELNQLLNISWWKIEQDYQGLKFLTSPYVEGFFSHFKILVPKYWTVFFFSTELLSKTEFEINLERSSALAIFIGSGSTVQHCCKQWSEMTSTFVWEKLNRKCSTLQYWSVETDLLEGLYCHHSVCNIWVTLNGRAATNTDFRNLLTGPPYSNCIQLTERFASPYGALCFHVFTGSDSP